MILTAIASLSPTLLDKAAPQTNESPRATEEPLTPSALSADRLLVLTLEGEQISMITRFGGAALLPKFGLAPTVSI